MSSIVMERVARCQINFVNQQNSRFTHALKTLNQTSLRLKPRAQQLKISDFEIDCAGLNAAATKLEIGQMLRVTGQLTAGRHIKA